MVANGLLFFGLFVFRVFNSFCIQTSFVPDEIWQSIEVAHKWIFGYGTLTWEWLPEVALRSPIHPSLIAIVYLFVDLFGASTNYVVFIIPRVIHALLAATTDFYLYKLILTISSVNQAKWSLFHQLCNWFTFYCAPRTLSNCLEWCLTTIALSCFPWSLVLTRSTRLPHTNSWKVIFIIVICVLVRPTAAVMWGPLCLYHLYCTYAQSLTGSSNRNSRSSVSQTSARTLLSNYCVIGLILLTMSCFLDRICFGRWTINQFNFLWFNVFTDGSHAYGVHPWHWYLTQGLPAMLTTQIPFVIFGIFGYLHLRFGSKSHSKQTMSLPADRILVCIIVWTIFVFSLQAHKEFRFLFPLLPIFMYFCGKGTAYLDKTNREVVRNRAKNRVDSRWAVLFILVTQIPMALYFCLVHQRGNMAALSAVSRHIHQSTLHIDSREQDLHSIHLLALMPCHSLPSVGYMHLNVTFKQLGCDPDLSKFSVPRRHVQHAEEYDFYQDPTKWLLDRYNSTSMLAKPNYVFLFDHLFETYPIVKRLLLVDWDYVECGRFFHAHFPSHPQHGRYVFVLCSTHDVMF